MKRIFLSVVTLCATIFFTGCSDNEGYDDGYSNVYLGVVIFSSGSTTNSLAMDGLEVMSRFAILNAEMKAANLEFEINSSSEPDWSKIGSYEFGGVELEKRVYLFGAYASTQLTQVTETAYAIEYNTNNTGHTCGYFDSNYRSGGYRIETNGLELSETSSDNPWSLSVYGKYNTFAYSNTTEAAILCDKMQVTFWQEPGSEGVYRFHYDASLKIDDDYYSYQDWASTSLAGTLEIEDFKTLLIEDTIDKNYNLSFTSAGNTIYGDDMTFSVKEPLVYNYSRYPTVRFGGRIYAKANDIDSSSFPSFSTEMSYDSNGYMTIEYNGYSYTF